MRDAAALMTQFQPLIRREARRQCRIQRLPAEAVDDVVQDVALRVLRQGVAERFDPERGTSYLRCVVQSAAVNVAKAYRRNVLTGAISLDEGSLVERGEPEAPWEHSPAEIPLSRARWARELEQREAHDTWNVLVANLEHSTFRGRGARRGLTLRGYLERERDGTADVLQLPRANRSYYLQRIRREARAYAPPPRRPGTACSY